MYKDGMPDTMLSAFQACVLYADTNTTTEPLVYRTLERNVDELLNQPPVYKVKDQLMRLQALLLYQCLIQHMDPIEAVCVKGQNHVHNPLPTSAPA